MDTVTLVNELRASADFMRGRTPLYERIVSGLAAAVEKGVDGGVVVRLLSTPGPTTALEARLLLLAALHHAALTRPGLSHAAWFPTAVGADARRPDDGAPAAAALEYLVDHEDQVAEFIATRRLQTNEIGRCAALLPGMLAAAALGLPLRLLEVGCSAGLNLLFDRYHYTYVNGPTWGARGSVTLEATAEGNVPRRLVPPTVEIAERRGVDLHPLRVGDADDERLLRSFVWPDEHDRQRHLVAAIEIARASRLELETGDLAAWATEHLHPEEGVTTVLFHSAVVDKLDDATYGRFEGLVERALRGAVAGAPVVHLRLESTRGTDSFPELILTIGDGDGPPRTRTVLTADFHGRWVTWW